MEYKINSLHGVDTEIIAPKSNFLSSISIIISALSKTHSKISNFSSNIEQITIINALKKFGTRFLIKENIMHIECKEFKIINSLYLGTSIKEASFILSLAMLCKGKLKLIGNLNEFELDILYEILKIFNIEFSRTPLPISIIIPDELPSNIEIKKEYLEYILPIIAVSPSIMKEFQIKIIGPYKRPKLDLLIKFMVNQNVYAVINNNILHIKGSRYDKVDISLPGDVYLSSYFFSIAAIHKGRIKIKNLDIKSNKFFLNCLLEMGCTIEYKKKSIILTGPNKLSNIVVDMFHYPELIPLMCIVASFSQGTSEISGISDYFNVQYIRDLLIELKKLGIKYKTTSDSILIDNSKHHPNYLNSYGNENLAMTFGILGLKVPGIKIINHDCINSNKDFWKILKKV